MSNAYFRFLWSPLLALRVASKSCQLQFTARNLFPLLATMAIWVSQVGWNYPCKTSQQLLLWFCLIFSSLRANELSRNFQEVMLGRYFSLDELTGIEIKNPSFLFNDVSWSGQWHNVGSSCSVDSSYVEQNQRLSDSFFSQSCHWDHTWLLHARDGSAFCSTLANV
jgi:hypothetical protein